jgi:hypothetical protein
LATFIVLLAACSGTAGITPPSPAREEPALDPTEALEETAVSQPEPTVTAVPPTAESMAAELPTGVPPIGDEEAVELMDVIVKGTPYEVNGALTRIEEAQDKRFIPVLIDAYRGWQLRLLNIASSTNLVKTLETLSGQTLGQDWPGWVEWYGNSDIEPPPGFTSWKGRMLAKIDPRFGDFLQESHPSTLRPEEIQWGRDQIYVLRVEGIPKAYPTKTLAEEMVVNDTIGEIDLVLFAPHGVVKVNGDNQYIGEVTYQAGTEVRAYERGSR